MAVTLVCVSSSIVPCAGPRVGLRAQLRPRVASREHCQRSLSFPEARARMGNRKVVKTAAECAQAERLNVKVFETDSEVADALIDVVLLGAREAIAEKGAFSLAVPGGRIPTMLSGLLSTPGATSVDWTKCHLYFVNERQNEGKCCKLNRTQFADALGIPEANIYAPATGESVDSAAAYGETLRSAAANVMHIPALPGVPPSLDMALVGLGNDGHIGSVYPGSDTAADATPTSLVLPVDKPGKQSITMSLSMMAAARRTVIATCGEGKVQSVAKAISLSAVSAGWTPDNGLPMPWLDAPSARLPAGPGETLWLLDAAAAGGNILE